MRSSCAVSSLNSGEQFRRFGGVVRPPGPARRETHRRDRRGPRPTRSRRRPARRYRTTRLDHAAGIVVLTRSPGDPRGLYGTLPAAPSTRSASPGSASTRGDPAPGRRRRAGATVAPLIAYSDRTRESGTDLRVGAAGDDDIQTGPASRPGPAVELQGIEPWSSAVSVRLLRVQSAMPFLEPHRSRGQVGETGSSRRECRAMTQRPSHRPSVLNDAADPERTRFRCGNFTVA